jgi:hypothetical protein
MPPFSISPHRRSRAPKYPLHAGFSPDELRRRPYRTGATRALAAALTAITGGAAAQGTVNVQLSNNRAFALAGEISISPQPMIADVIDPAAAQTLVNRLFEEAGLPLAPDSRLAKGETRLGGWNEEHRVGVLFLEPGDLPTHALRVAYLDAALDLTTRLPDDPRSFGPSSHTPELTPKERQEMLRLWEMMGPTGPARVERPNGERILSFDVADLIAGSHAEGSTPDPGTLVAERAAALQRLESQVREFIDYLRSQGI